MCNLKLLFAAGLTAVAFFYSHQVKGEGYKLVKQDEVISLYERWISSQDGEKVRELKAVFTVKSDITSITRLLTDPDRGITWNPNTTAYEILASGDENSWINYIQYNIPWPFDNQDCCLSYHLKKNFQRAHSVEIIFNSVVNAHFPESKQSDRIKGVRGKWLLDDVGNGRLKVTYFITTERSKRIPRWVSDPIIHNNLFNTMTAFKNILEDTRG